MRLQMWQCVYALSINENEIKYITTNNSWNTKHIQINNYKFEKINGFVYPEAYISSENNTYKEIEKIILSVIKVTMD